MSAESDIAAIDDGGANTASEVRTALTSVLARGDAAAPTVKVSRVETAESTTSTSFGDLSTSGPAVTVTVTASGVLVVHLVATHQHTVGGHMGFALSGSNTLAASVSRAVFSFNNGTGYPLQIGATFVVTGLASGSTTVTAKYRCASSGTATFLYRELSAMVGALA